MIVTQAAMNFVTGARCRRLLLPVERGECNELLPCPVEVGEPFKLWNGQPFVKGVAATVIGVNGVDPASVKLAIRVGEVNGKAWCVAFALDSDGEVMDFFDKHRERYLKRKGVGTTDNPDRAVIEEPAVTTEEELQLARLARRRRELEQRQVLLVEKRVIEQSIARLRAHGLPKSVEGELRLAERRLAKAERLLHEQAA